MDGKCYQVKTLQEYAQACTLRRTPDRSNMHIAPTVQSLTEEEVSVRLTEMGFDLKKKVYLNSN